MYYIYRITNLVNGKTYIGQHCPKKNEPFDMYLGSGVLIQKALKKYGKENFKKEILYNNIQYKDTADSVEIFAIAKEKAVGKAEYNISTGGTGGDLGPEVRKKISKANKGRISPMKGKHFSEDSRKKLCEANKGKHSKPLSEETKKKISEAKKGRHHTEETKKKISEAGKCRVTNNGMHWHLDENGKRVYTKGDK